MEQTLGLNQVDTKSGWGESDQDLAWIEASRRGDHLAFNRLVLKWERRVYNLVLRMLADPEEAAEATQEIFLSVFRHIRNFKGDARFSTWLYRIAVNQCISRLRKRPPSVHSLDQDDFPEGVRHLTADESQESSLFVRERRHQVMESLAVLSPQQRVVIELKFFQEETFASISDILGLPLSTIKSRFYTALDLLKVRLQPLEEHR